jgi:hypothetical protein
VTHRSSRPIRRYAFNGSRLLREDANHLCPVLTAGGHAAALDAAARQVRDERWPEIVTIQQMQQDQARMLVTPDRWPTRLVHRLLPFLVRTGLLQ